MGYGKLDEKNHPKRDKDYYCSVCKCWNDPFDRKNDHAEMLKRNVCKECSIKINKRDFYEKSQP